MSEPRSSESPSLSLRMLHWHPLQEVQTWGVCGKKAFQIFNSPELQRYRRHCKRHCRLALVTVGIDVNDPREALVVTDGYWRVVGIAPRDRSASGRDKTSGGATTPVRLVRLVDRYLRSRPHRPRARGTAGSPRQTPIAPPPNPPAAPRRGEDSAALRSTGLAAKNRRSPERFGLHAPDPSDSSCVSTGTPDTACRRPSAAGRRVLDVSGSVVMAAWCGLLRKFGVSRDVTAQP